MCLLGVAGVLASATEMILAVCRTFVIATMAYFATVQALPVTFSMEGSMPQLQLGIDCVGVCVVYFCHDGKGRFVMNLRGSNCRDEQGCWDIGGGAVDHGVPVLDTVRQEILEEYCTEVLDIEFLGVRDVHREVNGRPSHWIALDYKVLVDSATVANGEPHKFDDVRWYTKDTIPTPAHSQFPDFLARYGRRVF